MSDASEPEPTREEFLSRELRWAEITAGVEYDRLYGDPRKARETAVAWVGVIQFSTMGEVKGYARAHWGNPYPAPKTAVAAAAPGLHMEACDFRVSLVRAGEEFRVLDEHMSYVQDQVGEALFKRDPNERRTKIATFVEDFVCVSWHQFGVIFPNPDAPVPTTFRLLKPDDEREHEISRLTCSLLRLCPTEKAAQEWTKRRSAKLQAEHDKNHARQCKDKTCARLDHTHQPSHDD